MKKFLLWVGLILSPFIIQLKLTVYLYNDGVHFIGCFAGGVLAASLCFILLTWKTKIHKKFVIGFVLLYTLVSIFYISSNNSKTSEVKGEYYTLHPIVRMVILPVIILDHKTMITDISRQIEDYDTFELRRNEQSLHLIQADGYCYAVDFRTRDRWEIRNKLFEYYFRVLGLYTLRHVGTADHLHIQLRRNAVYKSLQ